AGASSQTPRPARTASSATASRRRRGRGPGIPTGIGGRSSPTCATIARAVSPGRCCGPGSDADRLLARGQMLLAVTLWPAATETSVRDVRPLPRPGVRARAGLAGLAVSCLLLGGCSGPQSALSPAGPSARRLANLWWGLFSVSAVVWLVVVFGVVAAVVLRRG